MKLNEYNESNTLKDELCFREELNFSSYLSMTVDIHCFTFNTKCLFSIRIFLKTTSNLISIKSDE